MPVNTYIDWSDEQTVGTAVNLTHEAATPPGLIVTGIVKLESVEGRKLISQSSQPTASLKYPKGDTHAYELVPNLKHINHSPDQSSMCCQTNTECWNAACPTLFSDND